MEVLIANTAYKPHFGGVENSMFYMSQILRNLGHKVVIVCGDKTINGEGRLKRREVIDSVEVYRFKRLQTDYRIVKIFAALVDIYRSYTLVRNLYKEHKFAVSIVRDERVGLGVGLALKRHKVIYIVPGVIKNIGNKNYNYANNISAKNIINNISFYLLIIMQEHLNQKILLNLSTKVYVFSENMRKQVLSIKKSVYHKLDKINPGIDTKRFIPISNKDELKKTLTIPTNSFVFLLIGRLSEVKGFDLAIKAFSELNNYNGLLLIVGSGPELEKLIQISKELNLTAKVIFINQTSIAEQYYQISDAFIMSSTYESFGQTILEAMSSGLPVVGFKPDGINVMTATDEIVEDGVNGILCDFSVEALSDAMDRILNTNKDKLNEIARINRQKVESQYSWDNFCEQILYNAPEVKI